MEYENVAIGEKLPPLEAKPVKVISYEEIEVITGKDKAGQDKLSKKLVLKVQHPDNPELEISKVTFLRGKKLKEVGLWLQKDKDGNIPYNSALASLLRFYNCTKIADIKDKELQTTNDTEGFCIAKAY